MSRFTAMQIRRSHRGCGEDYSIPGCYVAKKFINNSKEINREKQCNSIRYCVQLDKKGTGYSWTSATVTQ
jgi:hypothetical protein